MEDLTKIEVLVPLDGISPYLVKSPEKDLIATTEDNRIQFKLEKPSFQSLSRAMLAGIRVLTWLPETPVTAAGFNLSYTTNDPSPDIAQRLQNTIDTQLGNLKYQIQTRSLGRAVPYNAGQLNISFTQEDPSSRLDLNFHRGSSNIEDLKQWLQIPVEDIKKAADDLLKELNLDIEENTDDTDQG